MANEHCDAIREQIGALIDGELPADERAAVEAHLRACPACAAEREALDKLVSGLVAPIAVTAPETLWPSIASLLEEHCGAKAVPRGGGPVRRLFARRWAAAASVLLVIGLGTLAVIGLRDTTPAAEAATIDYSELLETLPVDPAEAFRRFLVRYEGREISAAGAHRAAPELSFAIPDELPCGFRRQTVYRLRFGSSPGVAARYNRADDFLVAIFHPPVACEHYGTCKDYPCVVGKHRGQSVTVGNWRLVHLTEPSTCHCVLSQLDPQTELPAVMAAVAPGAKQQDHGP